MRIQSLVQDGLKRLYQHPLLTLGVIGFITAVSFYICTDLELKSDFKRLLPPNKPSVVALNRIEKLVGGVGTHKITIETQDPDAAIEFIDDLVVKLKELDERFVRFVDYRTQDVKDYYTKHKFLYVDDQDLETIEQRLAKKIEYEKLKANPFFFDLEDKPVEFSIADIEEKYKGQTSEQEKYYRGYLFSADRSVAVVLVQPSGTSTGTGFSKQLTQKIASVVDELNPQSYHPSIQVTYGGKFLKVLKQYDQLISDMISTLGICLLLVALVIYLYFLRLRIIALLAVTLAIGGAWTFALAELFIGSLNSQTAFLGSIIIGNGVNSGIFFLARYMQERKTQNSILACVETACNATYFPTFTAALTTSVAFFALRSSEILGMSEFGLIGGVGMLLCWLATFTFLPAFIVLTERVWPMHKQAKKIPSGWAKPFQLLANGIGQRPGVIAGASLLFLAVCIVAMIQFLPHSLEYNFSNLKNKYEANPAEKNLSDKTKSIFGKSLTPSIILLDRADQAAGVCKIVMSQEKDMPLVDQTIEQCKTLQDFLPKNQNDKLATLARIRKLLEDDAVQPFYKKHQQDIDDIRATKNLSEITMQDLPQTLQRKYQEKDGQLGRIVFIYPREDANLNQGAVLKQYTQALTNIELEDGSKVSLSGDYPIYADLLDAIENDGPKISLYSFLAVSLLIILYLRNLSAIGFVLGSLCTATVLLLGIQSLFSIKLNFFNYIALPVTFGIGVDYAVNLYARYKEEGRGKMLVAIEAMGGAIALCSSTTIIGYLSLTQGINQALVSFGWLAFIGEISCLLAGLVIVPTWFYLRDRP
jgi:predicted RND superfamily exporter protein